MAGSSQADLFTDLGFDPAYLGTFEDKLFIEGPQQTRRLLNFFVLRLLATVIATYGVLSSSTATVIGAMVVAPLMGPILATTAAVVMGSLTRALRAFALSLVGTVSVIVFSYLLSSIVPDVAISFTSNPEKTSRIQPGLYALLTALGAGAAGAFIMSRGDISDALSGVAIAISLVPLLCVVGIALQQAQLEISNLVVPAENRIGEEGKGFRVIVEPAASYASPREVFDRKLGENQSVQFAIAGAYAETEAADLMRFRATDLFDDGQLCGPEANMAKLLASNASWAAANVCLDTYGGNGFNTAHDVERKFRETRLYQVAPISNNLILGYLGNRVLGMPRSF
jgi:uncharacterized hydrophobic protein (TIGR00271 family)